MEFATITGRVALLLGRPLLGRLAGGLERLAGPERDFGVVDVDADPARVVEQLLDWQPAGVIMEFREELTEAVASLGRPVVVLMADLLFEGMAAVTVDDAAIGRLAAEYLWDKRLRHFGCLGLEGPVAPGRAEGFAAALARQGARPAALELPPPPAARAAARQRRERLEAWLGALPRPAGVFAAHDPLGLEALEACRRLGLRVPEDLAILAASDDPAGALCHPGLSTVGIPWERIGPEALALLARLHAGARPRQPVRVPPSGIRTRGSTDFHAVSDPRLQRALRHMQEQCHAPLDIPAVARAAGMDRRALERLCRAQLGRSPKQLLTGMRTARARELLERTTLRVGEVAERCGFASGEQLAAAFRQRFGKTPRQWRKG